MNRPYKYFLALLVFCAVATACKEEKSPGPSLQNMQSDIFELINGHRVSVGLQALQPSEVCERIAAGHSSDMAEGVVPFSHDGFIQRFETANKELGASAAGENVALNYHSAADLVQAWVDSEPHRVNVEGDFTHMGISIKDDEEGNRYFTQFLVKI